MRLPFTHSNLRSPCEMPDSANNPFSEPASDLPAPWNAASLLAQCGED